jgi:hypothetical protein
MGQINERSLRGLLAPGETSTAAALARQRGIDARGWSHAQ